jgi:hypothetical protein
MRFDIGNWRESFVFQYLGWGCCCLELRCG